LLNLAGKGLLNAGRLVVTGAKAISRGIGNNTSLIPLCTVEVCTSRFSDDEGENGLSRTGKASVLIDGPSELALVERVSAVRQLLEGLVSQGVKAYVDGFSDVQSLPRDVMQALERLRDISPKNHRGFRRAEKTYMAIPVNLESPPPPRRCRRSPARRRGAVPAKRVFTVCSLRYPR
jgi:hypothetical protein